MIESAYESTQVLAKDADNVRKQGHDANQILNELVDGQKVMVDNINIVYAKTQEANVSARRISEVVELITELASETNLLSLNISRSWQIRPRSLSRILMPLFRNWRAAQRRRWRRPSWTAMNTMETIAEDAVKLRTIAEALEEGVQQFKL